jgi:hypothetical protein
MHFYDVAGREAVKITWIYGDTLEAPIFAPGIDDEPAARHRPTHGKFADHSGGFNLWRGAIERTIG